jgi:hypothetical protein
MLRGGVFRQDEKIAKILSGWAAELIVAVLARGPSGRNRDQRASPLKG